MYYCYHQCNKTLLPVGWRSIWQPCMVFCVFLSNSTVAALSSYKVLHQYEWIWNDMFSHKLCQSLLLLAYYYPQQWKLMKASKSCLPSAFTAIPLPGRLLFYGFPSMKKYVIITSTVQWHWATPFFQLRIDMVIIKNSYTFVVCNTASNLKMSP